MSIAHWSTNAANNASVDGIDFAEGQAPSTVNNSARLAMSDVRAWYEAAGWLDLGYTLTYVSSLSFRVEGDKRSTFTRWRRVRAHMGAGDVFGLVASTTYSIDTVVSIRPENGGALTASLSGVSVSILSQEHLPRERGWEDVWFSVEDFLPGPNMTLTSITVSISFSAGGASVAMRLPAIQADKGGTAYRLWTPPKGMADGSLSFHAQFVVTTNGGTGRMEYRLFARQIANGQPLGVTFDGSYSPASISVSSAWATFLCNTSDEVAAFSQGSALMFAIQRGTANSESAPSFTGGTAYIIGIKFSYRRELPNDE